MVLLIRGGGRFYEEMAMENGRIVTQLQRYQGGYLWTEFFCGLVKFGGSEMKRVICSNLVMSIVLVGGVYGGTYGGGTGEPNDPYLIYDANHMQEIGGNRSDWDKNFKMMADVNLAIYTGTQFRIIGISQAAAFTGSFDGNGYTIYNFTYSSAMSSPCVGLFGYLNYWAEIRDLRLINAVVNAPNANYVGALIGYNHWSYVMNCRVEDATVTGYDSVGGLIGENAQDVVDCYANASVSGHRDVGGLVGENAGWDILRSFTCGTVTGAFRVGGLSGQHSGGAIEQCGSAASVEAIGGYGGGLVGLVRGSCRISDCYAVGSVVGRGLNGVGGLIGNGGDERVTNCYAAGNVSGPHRTGGLIGFVDSTSPQVVNSFWDMETTGQATSNGGIGLTTIEMHTKTTYTDAEWDFVDEGVSGTWRLCVDGAYPVLQWMSIPGDLLCPDGVIFTDYSCFSNYWGDTWCSQSNDYCKWTDFDFSGEVDVNDLKLFIGNWLTGS
jgi:hypothetical protein